MNGSKACTGAAVCLLLLHTVLGAPKSTSGQPIKMQPWCYIHQARGPMGRCLHHLTLLKSSLIFLN